LTIDRKTQSSTGSNSRFSWQIKENAFHRYILMIPFLFGEKPKKLYHGEGQKRCYATAIWNWIWIEEAS
jgi:hypothetical protein